MEKIILLYNQGLPYKEIALQCKCSEYKIWSVIKKSGISMRGSGNSKPQKLNPFLSFSSEAMYWLGYIIADGTIVSTKRNHTLVLFSKDFTILKKFNLFMNNQCKIHLWNNNDVYGARLHSKVICDWLVNICNITPNKSTIVNPTLPITWDLLRGYFDGDGSITLKGSRKESKFTTGSLKWAERISSFLTINNIHNVITIKDNAYDVNIYRKEDSEKLYNKMYKNATIYLDYKYNRFVALFGNK